MIAHVVRNPPESRRILDFHIMITIRSSGDSSAPVLVALEATLTAPIGVYTICSKELIDGSHSPCTGALFGAISWPRSRFQLAPGIILEQQIFLPHDRSAAAFSWQLHSPFPMQAHLVVKPLFSGCGPRSYRDVGFQLQSENEGGYLIWLPNVRGPRIIADTNGSYRNKLVRTCDDLVGSCNGEHLNTPGTFEFHLSDRPSVLIFSNPDLQTKSSLHIGTFLAGLMPPADRTRRATAESNAQTESHLVRAAEG